MKFDLVTLTSNFYRPDGVSSSPPSRSSTDILVFISPFHWVGGAYGSLAFWSPPQLVQCKLM